MHIRLFFLAVLFTIGTLYSAEAQVQWTNIESALAGDRSDKKIMIDIYTKWCKWCTQMDQNTLQHPEISKLINEHFVAVKFDAEHRQPIKFKGQSFEFIKVGDRGVNALATELCKTLERLSFPTLVFIDEDLNVIQPIPGYQDTESMEVILHYMAGEHYKTTPFRSFKANFKSQLK